MYARDHAVIATPIGRVRLDGVDVTDTVGEVGGQDAQARPDLQHDVVGVAQRPVDGVGVVVEP